MAYKQYGGDKMSSPLTQKRQERHTDRNKSMSNRKYQRLKSFRARLHGGMTENEANRMRERAFQRRMAANDALTAKIDSHLPPRQSYEGWTDFQVQQAEATRKREIQGIRNRILEERFS